MMIGDITNVSVGGDSTSSAGLGAALAAAREEGRQQGRREVLGVIIENADMHACECPESDTCDVGMMYRDLLRTCNAPPAEEAR